MSGNEGKIMRERKAPSELGGSVVYCIKPVDNYRKMNVAASTNPSALSGAIISEWENGYAVELICMGRDAVYTGMRAIPLANGHVRQHGVSFHVDIFWKKIALDPFGGRNPATRSTSEQLYQIYESNGSTVVRDEKGNVIRFRAAGPKAAMVKWESDPRYSKDYQIMAIMAVVTLRLIPVQRGG